MIYKAAKLAALVAMIVAAFLAGAWYMSRQSASTSAAGERRILKYICPMHPEYTSDRPGIAPCCGMQLVPVYGGEAAEPAAALPPGAVQIGAERQRMIGVQAGVVERAPAVQRARILGRVAADERLVYKINATVDGWIRNIAWEATTGAIVRKNDILASFYAPEFLSSQQAYLFSLDAVDRFQASGKDTSPQMRITNSNIKQARDSLVTLGMSQLQADELSRTRQVTEDIRIVAPADGFIVARNVSPGQRFEKGTEFFRVADLSHVWVLADLHENESRWFRAGQSATAAYQGRRFPVRMSKVLPQFDPATRTLKIRFELDNPDYTLRPGMFVDVEYPVNLPAAVTVPAEAVIDSGLHKTVYVERAAGLYEPREVETGWRANGRVQIAKGLEPGERIVISGNFLIDSESRLKRAALRVAGGAGPR